MSKGNGKSNGNVAEFDPVRMSQNKPEPKREHVDCTTPRGCFEALHRVASEIQSKQDKGVFDIEALADTMKIVAISLAGLIAFSDPDNKRIAKASIIPRIPKGLILKG